MTENIVDWKSEINKSAFKYHTIIAWVAVILDPLFGISDYFINPKNFINFSIVRIIVSLLILITLIFKKKFIQKPHILALVPFIGISIQNAYMYSLMNTSELQKHTLAYLVLFIGAGMFVIWHLKYSIITVIVTLTANIILFYINSPLSINEIMVNGGILTTSVALFTILLIHTRTNLTKKEIIARLALAKSNEELALKNIIIEEKNKDIKDSINYSKRIQEAILPPLQKIDDLLKDYFILYKPKDIVSGDFYWCNALKTTPQQGTSESVIVLAAVDCTGHGVPGAMMSVIGSTILNQSIKAKNVNNPAEALNYLDNELSNNLNAINDGMDISLISINFEKNELQYSGANNPIFVVRNTEIIELKADKMPIGGNTESKKFTNHVLPLKKNDTIYLFTDGYVDQFGGPKGKKFKFKNFQELLLNIQNKPLTDQKEILDKKHQEWKGQLEQVDDILVIGIKI